jgi:hypothetical protein
MALVPQYFITVKTYLSHPDLPQSTIAATIINASLFWTAHWLGAALRPADWRPCSGSGAGWATKLEGKKYMALR